MKTYEFMKMTGERANAVNKAYSVWAKSRGVNYNILAVLYTAYHNDKCSQKYICEEWNVPKQTVNTTCRNLRKDGLIEQSPSNGDKREIELRLTDKGKAFAEPLVSELLKIEGRILNRLGEEELNRFFELYMAYADAVEEEFSAR